MTLPPSADGLLHGAIEIKTGTSGGVLVAFCSREDGVYHYSMIGPRRRGRMGAENLICV
jgi:hypothetical protein